MDCIAIFGPTAVGKTAVAIELAELLRARGEDPVAISADSMQVYDGLGTLTGAATAEQQAQLEHRLLGFVPVTQSFSVGEYMPLAHAEIDAALEAGRRPIVVGGTGLYLRAALTELDLRRPPDPELRARIERRMEDEGPDALLAEILEREPEAKIAQRDRNRIIRYLELLQMGEGPDPLQRRKGPGPPSPNQLWASGTRHPTLLVGLVMDRDELDRRIDARMEAIAAAAIDDVRAADAAGASVTARKAHGFEDLLRGDVEGMKLRARRFARRQMTWMRKMAGVQLVDATGREPRDVAAEVARLLPD
ncbi:MAG TPA: tRNA (adenosine(37)-N6)-dimethylallyltransferase MiaA [Thermoleophilaceae bacterium]